MRSTYLELRLIPAMEPGKEISMSCPDGRCRVFIAREVVDGGDYQRIELVSVEDQADAKE